MRCLTIAMGVLATLVAVPDKTSAFILNLSLNRANVIHQFCDADGDGVLTLEELAGGFGFFGVKKTVEQLARFDLDKDGILNELEIDMAFSLNPPSIIKWLDINSDGRLAVSEIQDHLKAWRIELSPMIVKMIFDADGDGFVSEEKLAGLPDRIFEMAKKFSPNIAENVENQLTTAQKRLERLARDIIYPMFKKRVGEIKS